MGVGIDLILCSYNEQQLSNEIVQLTVLSNEKYKLLNMVGVGVHGLVRTDPTKRGWTIHT